MLISKKILHDYMFNSHELLFEIIVQGVHQEHRQRSDPHLQG